MNLRPDEQAQLRALIYALPDEAFDRDAPENCEAAETIVAWHCLQRSPEATSPRHAPPHAKPSEPSSGGNGTC